MPPRSVLILRSSNEDAKSGASAVADGAAPSTSPTQNPRSNAAKIELIRAKLEDGTLDAVIGNIEPAEQYEPAEYLVRARRDAILAKRNAGVGDRAIAQGIARELSGVLSEHTIRQWIGKVLGPRRDAKGSKRQPGLRRRSHNGERADA